MGNQKTAADWLEILTTQKEPALDDIVRAATLDESLREGILAGLVSKDDTTRYNCFRVLFQMTAQQPALLYPQWDVFVGLLGSDNSYHRNIAVNIIANLTAADREDRFDCLFDRYFDLLDDEKVVTARYVARNAGKIARSKPKLQSQIAARLLHIDKTHHEPGRKDLIKADIIESFAEFFDASEDRATILAFVEAQLDCRSPKTRKAAHAFLKKHRQ